MKPAVEESTESKTGLKLRWITVGIYTAALYASLWIARPASEILRANALMYPTMYAIFSLVFLCLFYFLLRSETDRKLSSAAILIVSSAVLASTVLRMNIIEEAIHFVEYGFLSFLLYRALSINHHGAGLCLLVIITAFMLGWLDECIQYIVPNRGYDNRDVIFNGVGGAVGLFFTYILMRGGKTSRADNQ